MNKISALCIFCLFFSTATIAQQKPGPFETIGKGLDAVIADVVDYTQAMTKLAEDPLLEPLKIKVKIKEKTAYIIGTVDTDIQYDRAVTIVTKLNNVDEVNTELFNIKPSTSSFNDALITFKCKSKLLKSKYMDDLAVSAWSLDIETKNGIVYIVGEIDSLAAGKEALNLVTSIKGVIAVKYDLRVTGTSQSMNSRFK